METEKGSRVFSQQELYLLTHDAHGASEILLACGCVNSGCSEIIQGRALKIIGAINRGNPGLCPYCGKITNVVLCRPIMFAEHMGPFDDGER